MTSEPRIYMRHIRAACLCSRGARAWFTRHRLSWADFLMDGCAAERLIATGDPLAMRAVNEARKEAEDGRRGR